MRALKMSKNQKPYIRITDKGRHRDYKAIPGVPTTAYIRRYKAGSKKSVLSFITGKKPLVITMDTKGGRVTKIARGGRVESIRISPLMEEHFRKAIDLYLKNRIPRRSIKEAATQFSGENIEQGMQKIAKMMKRHESMADLLAQLPKPSKTIQAQKWDNLNRKEIYEKIAEGTTKQTLVEQMMKIGSRIDRRLYYTVTAMEPNGQPICTFQVKGMRPEDLAKTLKRLKSHSDAMQDTYSGQLFETAGIDKKHRIGKGASSDIKGGMLGRFEVNISFKTK